MEPSVKSVGADINWVSYGAVSPVKDQGQCTATYAFSAIGGIEGISAIFFKTQQEYSVQQLVDCSQSYGNNGCSSGNMVNSFNYIYGKGINTWNAYPYVARLQVCKTATGFFKINGYANVTSCSNLDLALSYRPISVAVDGNNFQNYRSGILDTCGTNVGLAALLVGKTDVYYTLKNSWGTNWGEGGYIRLLKKDNICGICQFASYPLPA
jgi:C1A family cysteine protease